MNTRMKWMALAVILMCAMMTGCKNNTQQPVSGTMEKAVAVDGAPQAVADLMKNGVIDDRYETLMEDKTTGVSVWCTL